MEGRGKKSSASLSVVSPLSVMPRMSPPDSLSASQKDIWHAVVAPLPADWWDASNAPLLLEYVRAVDMCNLLSLQIEATLAEGDPVALKDLLKLRDMESRRATSLATKMRISQQATYNAKNGNTAKSKAGAPRKPWDFGGKK